ncbi:hypothetical protein EBU95_05875 [bacterium]|nr:hypothetical protein [bacterium]
MKSLSKNIKYDVYEYVHNYCSRYDLENNTHLLDLLPYKQTLLITDAIKKRFRDYTEDIVYTNIGTYHPGYLPNPFANKQVTIDVEYFLQEYIIPIPEPIEQTPASPSPSPSQNVLEWRQTLSPEALQPLLEAVEWHVHNQEALDNDQEVLDNVQDVTERFNENQAASLQSEPLDELSEIDLSIRASATEMINRIMQEVMAETEQNFPATPSIPPSLVPPPTRSTIQLPPPIQLPTRQFSPIQLPPIPPRQLPPIPPRQFPPIPPIPAGLQQLQLPDIRFNGYSLIYEADPEAEAEHDPEQEN